MLCSIAVAANLILGQTYVVAIENPNVCAEAKVRFEPFIATGNPIRDADVYTNNFYRRKFVAPCTIQIKSINIGGSAIQSAENSGPCKKDFWYGF